MEKTERENHDRFCQHLERLFLRARSKVMEQTRRRLHNISARLWKSLFYCSLKLVQFCLTQFAHRVCFTQLFLEAERSWHRPSWTWSHHYTLQIQTGHYCFVLTCLIPLLSKKLYWPTSVFKVIHFWLGGFVIITSDTTYSSTFEQICLLWAILGRIKITQ